MGSLRGYFGGVSGIRLAGCFTFRGTTAGTSSAQATYPSPEDLLGPASFDELERCPVCQSAIPRDDHGIPSKPALPFQLIQPAH